MSMTIPSTTRPPRPTPETPHRVFDQLSLAGKVAVVTGAADGIGLAVAEAFAEAGATLIMWCNTNMDGCAKNAQRIRDEYGINIGAASVDVTNPEKIQAGIDEVLSGFGRLDIFVANAGMSISKPVLEMTFEEYRKVMSVNVDSVFHCAKAAGTVFKAQGRGSFIITGSISSHIVNVPIDQPVYNASKAAITQLGKSLAREWREFARVNIVSPGFFDTNMGAAPACQDEAHRMAVLGRQGNTREIKGVYLYLASDASSYQTGSDVIIDGGYTLP